MDYHFCGAFIYDGRLFVCREQGSKGARRMIIPPLELSFDVSETELGRVVLEALANYEEIERHFNIDERHGEERDFLAFFNVTSYGEFERRKKCDICIRAEMPRGILTFFSNEGGKEVAELFQTDQVLVGKKLKDLLKF